MKRKVLERTIEASVVKYAKDRGVEVVKLNGMGKQGLPDRMFLGPKGRVLFIEFKRPGKEPTELQAHIHAKWDKLGHRVYVVDDSLQGKQLVSNVLLKQRLDLDYPL